MSFMAEQSMETVWLPVVPLSHGSWLGVVDNDLWVGNLEDPVRQVDIRNPIGLLPLLERPYDTVLAQIRQREEVLSLNKGELLSRVPLDEMMLCVLGMRSDYWANLALGWLGVKDLSDGDKRVIEELSAASWASQRVRHRAHRLLKAIRAS